MAASPSMRLAGYRAIAAALSEAFGWPVSEDAAYRLASRAVRPLPIDGYRGRVWTTRALLDVWVTEERRRTGRVDASRQLSLLPDE